MRGQCLPGYLETMGSSRAQRVDEFDNFGARNMDIPTGKRHITGTTMRQIRFALNMLSRNHSREGNIEVSDRWQDATHPQHLP